MATEKYRFYAVWREKNPGIYTSWEDCKEEVNGFKDAEFKGFRLLRDAKAWLGLVDPPLPPPPLPELPSGVDLRTGLLEQLFYLSTHFNSMQVGPTLGESSQKSFVPCSQTPLGANTVPETSAIQFVLVEDMEVYLIRVCCQLKLDYPVFNRREFFSDSGELLHGYWVTLQSQQHDVNWIVEGGFSSDEQNARQDASFKMLGKVLYLLGKEIHDYKYKIVAGLRGRVEELERQLSKPVYQQIRDLEQENQNLKSDLEKYNELFEC